ncbi:MAG: Flp pilus assembly protein CpaB [Myxococcota bacterium]|nr:Flp pilus assembly protein CpaB [Myxococcota bacterium]
MSGSSQSKRAKLGAIGFTIVAIALALFSAILLARLMKGRGYDQDALVNVVVAKQDLKPGIGIEDAQLELKLWPKKSIPKGAFRSKKTLLASANKVPLHTILAGEPVLAGRLSHPKKGSGMAPLIPQDLRAFPVKIERWVAASKMVYPGALVDVMSTVKLEEGGFTSRTILQGVKVIAVNGAVDGMTFIRGNPKQKKKAVKKAMSVATLLLTPTEAEELALATRIGKIDIVLRSASDEAKIETDGVNVKALYPSLAVTAEADDKVRRPAPAAAKRRRTRKATGVRAKRALKKMRKRRKSPAKSKSNMVGG